VLRLSENAGPSRFSFIISTKFGRGGVVVIVLHFPPHSRVSRCGLGLVTLVSGKSRRLHGTTFPAHLRLTPPAGLEGRQVASPTGLISHRRTGDEKSERE